MQEEVDGEEYHVEDEENNEQSPFKCILEVGIKRTRVRRRAAMPRSKNCILENYVSENMEMLRGVIPPATKLSIAKFIENDVEATMACLRALNEGDGVLGTVSKQLAKHDALVDWRQRSPEEHRGSRKQRP